MPAFWSFRLVSLCFRKSACSGVESLMSVVGSLMTGRWFGNLKFLLSLISPYCQDRSDALSLTCSASIETVLAPTWGEEPWWSRGDRRSHCEARKMRVPCTCFRG